MYMYVCIQVVDVVEDTDCVPSEDIASILAAVISSLGIIFNILNIIIASQKSFKGSLHVYLITLSAVDALFLLIVSPLRSFRCGGCCPPPTTTVSLPNQWPHFYFIWQNSSLIYMNHSKVHYFGWGTTNHSVDITVYICDTMGSHWAELFFLSQRIWNESLFL